MFLIAVAQTFHRIRNRRFEIGPIHRFIKKFPHAKTQCLDGIGFVAIPGQQNKFKFAFEFINCLANKFQTSTFRHAQIRYDKPHRCIMAQLFKRIEAVFGHDNLKT